MTRYFISYTYPNPNISSFEKDTLFDNIIIDLEDEIKDQDSLNKASSKIIKELNKIASNYFYNINIINFIKLN